LANLLLSSRQLKNRSLNPAPVILEILSGGVMAGNKSYANPIDPFPR
jgi:hypothetical protein